jgi:cholesterol oxidase
MLHQVYGRRRFLQDATLFSTGLLAFSLIDTLASNAHENHVEAVVIGSGFGGSVAALRLGRAKINTLVIERGRRWTITDPTTNSTFATFRQPDGRAAWLSPVTFNGIPLPTTGDFRAPYTGVLEARIESGLPILAGAGVGGGSLVYNAVLYQPPRELFYRIFPASIDYDELDRIYYPRVRAMLQAKPLPQDILATEYYESTRIFLQKTQEAGVNARLIDLAVNWNTVRQELKGKRVPAAIIGEHWYGINSGAKTSLDETYLARAEKTGCVKILPLHRATQISEAPDGQGYQISLQQIDEHGVVLKTKTITCRYLFLAAGSLGTSELLVKAKATGTLPKLNDAVGSGWGTNGMVSGFQDRVAPTTRPAAGEGGPASAVVEVFDNPEGPVSITLAPTFGVPQGTLTSLSIGIPNVRGKFVYDPAVPNRQVRLVWPEENPNQSPATALQQDPALLQATRAAYNRLYRDGNANLRTLGVTAHPLGGAVLGQACDEYGRVKGYEDQGLYVVDGALIPGSAACTNPAFTIAAIAERNMRQILKQDLRMKQHGDF